MIWKYLMMSIAENLGRVAKTIPPGVKLIAVSKTYPPASILEAYKAGQRSFGENRVQELVEKHTVLPMDIEWHLIGHLQKNKVKYIAPFVSLIHAVDSPELLAVIDREAGKAGRKIACLIQLHIASEATKFGFSYSEAEALLNQHLTKTFQHVEIAGLMGMATFTDNSSQVRSEFRKLAAFFRKMQAGPMLETPSFSTLSMGMSGDYLIAIEEGATMVRIGSAIFGQRH
jgi:pyridoxal phosphate enzyme (YggS family)